MLKIPMSPAAAALLRAILGRTGARREQILLTDLCSVDWQSLTFTGERHEIELRIKGPDSGEIARSISFGLSEAEFRIAGHVVADIALAGEPRHDGDGSVILNIEALTISE